MTSSSDAEFQAAALDLDDVQCLLQTDKLEPTMQLSAMAAQTCTQCMLSRGHTAHIRVQGTLTWVSDNPS